jgi:hypothetical protein
MSDNSLYSFSDPFSRGIDFYQGDESDVFIEIQVSSGLTVSLINIINIASDISASASLDTSFTKIAYAAADLSVDGATVIVATERQDGSVSISGDVSLSTNITKIAYSNSSISANSDISVTSIGLRISQIFIEANSNVVSSILKFAHLNTALSSNTNVLASGTAIKFASANLSGSVNLSTIGRITLATARIILLQNTNVSAKLVKFSSVTGVDSSSIRTLLILDGKPLTNQNRTLSISSMPVFIENKNWAGDSSRYYKNQSSADKKSFSINWRFIPNFREFTVDERHSRDYLRKISLDPDVHQLKVINQDSDGVTPYTETVYNVFIKDFSEDLIRRDMVDNVYYFDCSISLEEV